MNLPLLQVCVSFHAEYGDITLMAEPLTDLQPQQQNFGVLQHGFSRLQILNRKSRNW
jgi:hypothetical protein